MDTLALLCDPLIVKPDYNLPSPVHADPLIEVCSVTIYPYDEIQSYKMYGEIYVYDKIAGKNQLYKRGLDNPETITSGDSLLLSGPVGDVISMVGEPYMAIKLKVHGKDRKKKGENVWFALGSLSLDTMTQYCWAETKSLTFRGSLGVVRVDYIAMPCASIADMEISVSKQGEDSLEYEEHDTDIDSSTSSCHDANMFGSVIASYGKTAGHIIGSNSHVKHPSFVLFKKREDECERVAYKVPIALSRSFVCMPAYSSLSLTLNLTLKDFGDLGQIVFIESTEFEARRGVYQEKRFSVGNYTIAVLLCLCTCDDGDFLEKIHKLRQLPPSACSIPRSVSPNIRTWGRNRIEVLSVVVGHEGKEIVDLCGIITVRFFLGSSYIFKRDEKHPDNLSRRGKAACLEGLTTALSDWLSVGLRLKDSSGLVDIHNYLTIYYHQICGIRRHWFNRPLCSVVFGNCGFAVVHYIIFEEAVKATLKISVIAKDSGALPFVYGALVAQCSNYEYSTSYQRNYWRSVLFEEPQEKDAHHVTEDGEIPLSRDVVSVPMGSSLVIDTKLHASVRRPAGATHGSLEISSAEYFVDNVEFEIDGIRCKKLEGKFYDVLFSVEWTEGR